ncbi:MAG: ABC transporter permease [Ferruginibacter sp.]|nr:ABC transporter permease [Cytophagales bacterium]
MLRNYLTTALRNLWRNKLYSVLNIVGLAIGISACLVICLIVSYEFSFDTYHADRDRIFRVYSQFTGSFEGTNSGVPMPLPAAVRSRFTGIEASTGFFTYWAKVQIPEGKGRPKVFEPQNDLLLAEPQYFEVFAAYRWLAGSPAASLSAPFQVVLTESKARTYFGSTEPAKLLGRQIHYNDSLVVTVSGIVKDLPKPTDFHFNDFISFSTIQQTWLKQETNLADWDNTNSAGQFFVKLAPGTRAEKITSQLRSLVREVNERFRDKGAGSVDFRLQPLPEMHFGYQLYIFDGSRAAHLPTLRALGLVALLLLLIAAINFINLITAQAVRRAKEVGVRKVLGGTRRELIRQFLSETTVLTTFATLLSLLLAAFAIRFFREFIPAGVALRLTDPLTWVFLLLTIGLVSLLSGSYPAFVLSSYAPVLALKNQAHASSGKTRTTYLRRGLIVFQFAIAQVLIVGTLMVGRQIDFMLNKEMGFARDEIIGFSTPRQLPNKRLLLRQELAKLPEVAQMSLHFQPPASNAVSSSILYYHRGKEVLEHNVHRKFGDTAYIHLYRIPLLAGRNLLPSDSVREFLINETYARQLGFGQPDQALGKVLDYNGKMIPIVGVMKDFHVRSLHEAIPPVVVACDAVEAYRYVGLQLATRGKGAEEVAAIFSKIGGVYKEVYANDQFEYTFLDTIVANFYQTEQRMAKLMKTATGVAILLSCLGLFGLVTYTAEQRTKEIGIRKVLGATVTHIVSLLSKDFVKLVLLANVIAWPLAWWAVNQWLRNFAYPVGVGWWIFAAAGGAALLIALLTVSFQAIKAALANPVKSLRTE